MQASTLSGQLLDKRQERKERLLQAFEANEEDLLRMEAIGAASARDLTAAQLELTKLMGSLATLEAARREAEIEKASAEEVAAQRAKLQIEMCTEHSKLAAELIASQQRLQDEVFTLRSQNAALKSAVQEKAVVGGGLDNSWAVR